jgi:hypothetical protein
MTQTIFNICYLSFGILLSTGTCYGIFRASRTFLLDADKSNLAQVRCVTRLLTVAFCLLMAGYMMVSGPFVVTPLDPNQLFLAVSFRFGYLLLVTGLTIFIALFILGNLRNRTRREGNRRESILA